MSPANSQLLDGLSFSQVVTTPLWNREHEESPLRRAIVAGLLDAAFRGAAWPRSGFGRIQGNPSESSSPAR